MLWLSSEDHDADWIPGRGCDILHHPTPPFRSALQTLTAADTLREGLRKDKQFAYCHDSIDPKWLFLIECPKL